MSAASKIWLLSLVLASTAQAADPVAQTQTPTRTSATYGDWSVRCDQGGTPPQKSCDLVLTIAGQGQNGQSTPMAQVLVTRPNKKESARLVMELPANVLIAPGIKLNYDDKQPPLALPFSRCFSNGCFASGPLADDAAKKLHARTDPGRIEYKDGNQKDIALPISFNGFAAAYDAWLKEQ
jgi:invasion protein IalB